MGIILALVAFALCAIVYVRMVKREIPEPISKKQAIIPVAAGLAAPILATILIIEPYELFIVYPQCPVNV